MGNDGLTASGFYSMTTSTSAAAALSNVFGGTNHIPIDANNVYQARAMLIRAETNNAYYTLDGTTPTSGAGGGMLLSTTDNGPIWIYGLSNILRFQAISVTGAGKIDVIFFE